MGFHFILRYPLDTEGVFYEWTQESNPTTDLIRNYTEIVEPYTGQNWGGLEPDGINSLMDGSVGHAHWFYAIGANRLWQNGVPGYAKTDIDVVYPQQVVELYTVNSVIVTNEPTFRRTGEPVETTSEPSEATSEPTAATLEPTPAPTQVTMEPTVTTLEPSPEPTLATMEPTVATLEPSPEPTLVTQEPTLLSKEPTAETEEPTEATLEPTLVTAEPTLVVTDEPTMSSVEPTTAEPTGATLEPTTLVPSPEPTTATEPTTLPSYINVVVISDFENDWNGVVDVVEDTHEDFYTKHGDAGYMLLGSAVLVLCAMCCCSRWLCSSKSKVVQADTKVQVIIDAKTLEHGLQGSKNTPLAKTATKSPALTDASSITDYDSITLQLYVTQPEGLETMEAVE